LNWWRNGSVRSFLLPGGLVLVAMPAVLYSGHFSAAVAGFYYAASFSAALLLAWRFHSTCAFFALISVLLADAARIFSFHAVPDPSSRALSDVASVLLPLTFVALALLRERGFVPSALGLRFLILFLQAVFVALLSRPDHVAAARIFHRALLNPRWFAWTPVPQLSLLTFAAGLGFFLIRFYLFRKPVESGFFWSLLALFLAFHAAAGRTATAYLATTGMIMALALIETSYMMAYHDELTGLPARRAFNQALLGLPERYSVAIVDVDHFKRFNDKYGHDTGDNVLRLVAARLAQVTGGGKSFRCGGEEFAILFPDRSVEDVLDDLERLRETIEHSTFRLRRRTDRRSKSRGADRRKSSVAPRPRNSLGRALSVTVSIGVAEPSTRDRDVEQVIKAADQALYRAKEAGRNRVEARAFPRLRNSGTKKAGAGSKS
jgi:diguanylate cyclase (GGDEF)-like protein